MKKAIILVIATIAISMPCYARKNRKEKEVERRLIKENKRKRAEKAHAKRIVENARKRTKKAGIKRQKSTLKLIR